MNAQPKGLLHQDISNVVNTTRDEDDYTRNMLDGNNNFTNILQCNNTMERHTD